MKGIERRVVSLEERCRRRNGSLAQLDDSALYCVAIGVAEEIEQAGVTMPNDWRNRFWAAPGSFMDWIADRAGKMAECAG